jgi:hypothetical protein
MSTEVNWPDYLKENQSGARAENERVRWCTMASDYTEPAGAVNSFVANRVSSGEKQALECRF